ncbi:DUF5329 domain-containing protein [Omnitrophica bacterium]|nr:DUF5329 domain-containing protein [Candidatus Omnitrophota bacterium]
MRSCLVIGVCFLVLPSVSQAAPVRLPPLSETLPSQGNRFYQTVLDRQGDEKSAEAAKIMYLIQQVRQSPYEFVRNGKTYPAPKAANHLLRKYTAVRSRVDTAKKFIFYIATKSEATGIPYMVKFSDGTKYSTRDVLSAELQRLEADLSKGSGEPSGG